MKNSGEWGEEQAAKMLRKKRYKILGRRVRPGGRDELDIVARDGKVLVFVEVKTRKNENYGTPSDAVKAEKRRVMSRGAVRYVKQLKNPDVFFRFDVVEVIGVPSDEDPQIRHIEDAFPLHHAYFPPA
jgi:putative endonuclease